MSDLSGALPDAVVVRRTVKPRDITDIAALWVEVNWGKAGQEDIVRRAIDGSDWVGIAEINDQFAGYARAFSDRVIVTYLAEVAVVPSFRRRGVAKALVQDCLHCFSSTSIYADASPEMVPLLEQVGLLPRPRFLTACSKGPAPSTDPTPG